MNIYLYTHTNVYIHTFPWMKGLSKYKLDQNFSKIKVFCWLLPTPSCFLTWANSLRHRQIIYFYNSGWIFLPIINVC